MISGQGQDRSVLGNALKMAFGTMTSRILGQLRESLLASYFDKQVTDAWNAAFKIPNLFRRLLGEGSLSVSFIPVFVDCRELSQASAQNLVNSVYSFLLLVLLTLTAAGILAPSAFADLVLAENYVQDAEKYLLTVKMAQIMFGFIFFVSSYAFIMGILNALGQFALPAMAPTFMNICMIISTLLPDCFFSFSGEQLAYGVLIGGLVQMLILVPALFRSGYLPRLSFNFRNPHFLQVLKNMTPGLVGMGLMQFTTIANLKFSSSLAEGTISYINYVDRLVELPLSLISVSLGTALLPSLSGLWARSEKQQFAQTAKHYLQLNLLFTMAAAAGLYVLAHPIVSLLFGWGKFGAEDVTITAKVLQTYCWIMIFSSGVRVLTPAYFAVKNTWFPALVSAVCLGLHILIAPLLMAQFAVHGLMASTILSAALNLFLLLLFFRKYVTTFAYLDFLKSVSLSALVALLTAFAAWGAMAASSALLPAGERLYLPLQLSFSLLAAGLCFFAFSPGSREILKKFKS